ncbi:MAG: hypothetical protein ABI323_02140 [Solirubrobacteraceae bacterium]
MSRLRRCCHYASGKMHRHVSYVIAADLDDAGVHPDADFKPEIAGRDRKRGRALQRCGGIINSASIPSPVN